MHSHGAIAASLSRFAAAVAIVLPALLIGLLPVAHTHAHAETERSVETHDCGHGHEDHKHPRGPVDCDLCEHLLLVFGSAALTPPGGTSLWNVRVAFAETSIVRAVVTREAGLHLARGPPAA